MELGEKLKTARLEAGLSQRQLCGDVITRNMLSLIENGAARPSMDTLRYLAGRLEKNVSWFLEEDAVTSPNQHLMVCAREAYRTGNFREAADLLAQYREPDSLFAPEKELLSRLTTLALAEQAAGQGKSLYAAQLLESLEPLAEGYCTEDLERRRLLLLARVQPRRCQEICSRLPPLDTELMLRARDALDCGNARRSAVLLEAAEERQSPQWQLLRGQVHLALGEFAAAAECFHKAEASHPQACAAWLEQCYRELGDFRQAYHYACLQR